MNEDVHDETVRNTDSYVVSSFLLSAIFVFLFWLISFFYTGDDNYWTTLHFQSTAMSLFYFLISVIVFGSLYYVLLIKKKDLKFVDAIVHMKKKYVFYFAIILCISFLFLTVKHTFGENWPTQMARSVIKICAGCPLQAYRLEYFTSSPLAAFLAHSAAKIGFSLNYNMLVSFQAYAKLVGVLFIIALFYFASRHYSSYAFPFIFINFFTASILSFYGVAGHANFIGILFLLLFYLTSYDHIKHNSGLFYPAIFASLTLLSHLSTVFVLPTLTYLMFYDKVSLSHGKLAIVKNKFFKAIVVVLAGLIIPYAIFYGYVSYDLSQHGYSLSDLGSGDATFGGRGFVPFTTATMITNSAHYTYFSFAHLLDAISHEIHLNAFRFLFVLLAIYFILRHGTKNPLFNFHTISCIGITLSVISWHNDLGQRLEGWETFAFTILPFTLMSSYLVFDYMRNEHLKKSLSFLLMVSAVITLIPFIVYGFTDTHFTNPFGTITTTAHATGVIRDHKFITDVHEVSQGETIAYYFLTVAGFKKDASGSYRTSMRFIMQHNNQDIQATSLSPVTSLIKDYPGESFGFIPGDVVIPLNTSSLPQGNFTYRLIIEDEVTHAILVQHYQLNILPRI